MDPVCYFLGDIGCLNKNLNEITLKIEEKMQLGDKIFLLGDNFYNHGICSQDDPRWNLYKDLFKPLGYRNIYSAMGNHDYEGNPYVQLTSKYMMNTEFYYKYRFSLNTEIFVLDTVQLYENHCAIGLQDMIRVHNKTYIELEERQLNWLSRSLRESRCPNKVVIGHYPILSNGIYGDFLDPLYDKLMPIFEHHKVKVYISGHEHNAQFIEKLQSYHCFNQLIVGSSSECRADDCEQIHNVSMYDNTDNFYLRMSECGRRLIFDYINKAGKIKYNYII